jgi:hypothetical protein
MCEVSPGPRCSYDMDRRLKARRIAYTSAVKKHGKTSPEALLSKAKMFNAQLDYDATPEGLDVLKKQIQDNPADERAQSRLNNATTIRSMQSNALAEIKNKRVDSVATAYLAISSFFTKEEIVSVVESSRELQEEKNLYGSINETSLDERTARYNKLINTLETFNNESQRDGASKEVQDAVQTLRSLGTPDEVNLKTYETLPHIIQHSKNQLEQQITNVAALQNTSPKIAQTYYDAYREQYQNDFSKLDAVDQPNPPESWVKGEFKNSGYTQDPTSRFAPHDKASMYAMYRLRSDENAIPDYMKQSKQYVSIQTIKSQDGSGTTIQVSSYNTTGKQVKSVNLVSAPNLMTSVSHELEGKILLSSSTEQDIAHKLRNKQSTIDSREFITKHFDLPSYSNEFVKSQLISSQKGATDNEHVDVFFTARKKVRQAWKAKAARANAPAISTPFPTNRWAKVA